MAAAIFARRLTSNLRKPSPSISSLFTIRTPINPSPTPLNRISGSSTITDQHPSNLNPPFLRWYSNRSSDSESKPNQKQPSEYPSKNPDFKHKEMEGPTVERDLSPLANETRAVLEKMMKNMYVLSRFTAAITLLQLGIGTWIAYATAEGGGASAIALEVHNCVAFGFPFAIFFMLRRSLKPMHFFKKMEEQGRLQILTLALQVAKNLNVFFIRASAASVLCIVTLSLGMAFALFPK